MPGLLLKYAISLGRGTGNAPATNNSGDCQARFSAGSYLCLPGWTSPKELPVTFLFSRTAHVSQGMLSAYAL